MARFAMEFERELFALEDQLEELQKLDVTEKDPELVATLEELTAAIERLRAETYADLTPWERVQISRHPDRPKLDDYLYGLFTDLIELHGDRAFDDDEAIFAGLGTLGHRRVAVIGHRKGSDTKTNVKRNFGMPEPEGYRKAMRIMRLAEKFALPLVTFLDTPGAHPGVEAENHGQGIAIAESISLLSGLRTPVVVVGIGEGGSGGALAIGFGDKLIMLENAYFSVITPESCASILYKDASKAAEVAPSLKMTAEDLLAFGIADEVVTEPREGAHRDPAVVVTLVGETIGRLLDELTPQDVDALVAKRYERLRGIGAL